MLSASNDDEEESSLPSSGNEDDAEEEEENPLEQLHRLGFAGGEAVDALMQCGGNVEQAQQQLLAAAAAAEASSDSKPTPSSKTKAGKGGRNKKKGKNKSSSNDTAAATSAGPSSEQEQGKSKNSSSNNSTINHKKKNFKEQRKQELRFQKALRDQRRVCRVCGGPHPRKECPGIADDGRGHSLHRDPRTRKKENQRRKDFEAQKQKDEEFLQMGVWTGSVVPYYDCFADLVQAYRQQHHDQRSSLHPRHRSLSFDGTSEDETVTTPSPPEQQTIINEGLAGWILDWATLNVKLGEDPIHTLSPEQRKVELQSWSGSRLQKAARALLSDDHHQEVVDVALRDRNPRSSLIRILLAAPRPELFGAVAPPRTLHREWPGYRGCVSPFSVLDASAMDALEQLQNYCDHPPMCSIDDAKNDARPSAKNGVKALLSIPPADVAKWMVVVATEDGSTTNNKKTEPDPVVPIDLSFFTRESEEMERTQAASKRAQAQLLAHGGSGKKGRASAEAEVTKLRKAMAGQRVRQVGSDEVLQGAAQARLSPTVLKSLDDALEAAQPHCDDENSTSIVVGISCGLDYDTAEARHSVLGKAVRTAQKAACQYAIVAATKLGLPVVLECQDASATKELLDQQQAGHSDSSASSDLVRILVEAAPPEMTLVLRNGSLTTAAKPGVQKLLNTWPKLYLGMSASLAYSKCPKELLDVAYDLPLERLCLMSEAPFCLPPALSGSHLVGDCAPPHVACVAEIVAGSKSGTDSISREEVLRRSADLASGVFRFTAAMNEN